MLEDKPNAKSSSAGRSDNELLQPDASPAPKAPSAALPAEAVQATVTEEALPIRPSVPAQEEEEEDDEVSDETAESDIADEGAYFSAEEDQEATGKSTTTEKKANTTEKKEEKF